MIYLSMYRYIKLISDSKFITVYLNQCSYRSIYDPSRTYLLGISTCVITLASIGLDAEENNHDRSHRTIIPNENGTKAT